MDRAGHALHATCVANDELLNRFHAIPIQTASKLPSRPDVTQICHQMQDRKPNVLKSHQPGGTTYPPNPPLGGLAVFRAATFPPVTSTPGLNVPKRRSGCQPGRGPHTRNKPWADIISDGRVQVTNLRLTWRSTTTATVWATTSRGGHLGGFLGIVQPPCPLGTVEPGNQRSARLMVRAARLCARRPKADQRPVHGVPGSGAVAPTTLFYKFQAASSSRWPIAAAINDEPFKEKNSEAIGADFIHWTSFTWPYFAGLCDRGVQSCGRREITRPKISSTWCFGHWGWAPPRRYMPPTQPPSPVKCSTGTKRVGKRPVVHRGPIIPKAYQRTHAGVLDPRELGRPWRTTVGFYIMEADPPPATHTWTFLGRPG